MRFLLLLLLIISASIIHGQAPPKTSLWIHSIRHNGDAQTGAFLKVCRTEIAEAFLKQGAFSVVDREFVGLLETEREIQKSESFIDGKIVEQGKGVGAEYIVTGTFDAKSKKMELSVVGLSSETVVAREEQTVDPAAPYQHYKKQLQKLIDRLVNQILKTGKITIVRPLEDKGSESRMLLIAGGSNNGLQKGQSMEVFYLANEEVDGETFERFISAGEIKIERIENENFSHGRVKRGGKEIFKLFTAKEKLYCRAISD